MYKLQKRAKNKLQLTLDQNEVSIKGFFWCQNPRNGQIPIVAWWTGIWGLGWVGRWVIYLIFLSIHSCICASRLLRQDDGAL